MDDIRPSGQPTTDPVRDHDAGPVAPAEPSRTFAKPRPTAPPPRYGAAAHMALAAEPLPDLDDPAFGRLFDRFGDGRVVLLGGATHGTSEFYRARAAITRWLIETRGFNILALEADGMDARVLDAQARGRTRASPAAPSRARDWRWRNAEFDAFLTWLIAHNRGRPMGARTAIHGLDRYNLAGSMRMAVDHLAKVDPEVADLARDRFGCAAPWSRDDAPARAAGSGRYASREAAVTSRLADALGRELQESAGGDEALLGAAEATRLIREAPAYYRAMYYGGAEAWNLRARHMAETLQALLDSGGRDAKVVVWAHNAHVGDARATEMGAVLDELSLGQLCRETWGDEVRLIGMGCHAGEVACAGACGERPAVKPLRPSLPESQERDSHDVAVGGRFLLDLRPQVNSALRRALSAPRLERFVGAVYHPDTERQSHYVACRLPEQFDAWVWFDETSPVSPLPDEA